MVLVALAETRLDSVGDIEGTNGADICGGGRGGTFAALPIPLGSLSELLMPPMLPGPFGIPLTPASWAISFKGIAAMAIAKSADLPNMGSLPVRVMRSLDEDFEGDRWLDAVSSTARSPLRVKRPHR